MRSPFRAIMIGILTGAAFFFFPFLFRILLFVFIVGLIIRLFSGLWWHRRWNYHRRPFRDEMDYDYDSNDMISIDGSRYMPPIRKAGPETRFPVE